MCRTISDNKVDFLMLAFLVIGFAVPSNAEREYWLSQQRLIPHAEHCTRQSHHIGIGDTTEYSESNDAFHNLGVLYADQGKLVEAEKMYQRALDGKERAWGAEHTSTLDTVNSLGNLYKDQGKLAEAEKMYQRALDGYGKTLGPNHTSTLRTVNNLRLLNASRGEPMKAEEIHRQALDRNGEARDTY